MKLLMFLALLPACFAASAQPAYPAKPITIVVPFGPGGVADITARTVGQAMAASLKQPIVIDNRPSVAAVVGSTAVAKAAPDGYTLLLMSNANSVSAGIFKKLPYEPVKGFAPIGTLGYFDLALFVADRSPLKSVQDLVARAKAQPGRLTAAREHLRDHRSRCLADGRRPSSKSSERASRSSTEILSPRAWAKAQGFHRSACGHLVNTFN